MILKSTLKTECEADKKYSSTQPLLAKVHNFSKRITLDYGTQSSTPCAAALFVKVGVPSSTEVKHY